MEKLAGFQIKILRNALTKFPDAKRIVYSTCSMFQEENEDVVRQVLETNSLFKLVPTMNFVNNTWKNFGSSEFGDIGSFCLYAKPNEDFTNGFFVAVFERLEEGEENQFFNTKIYNFKKHLQSQENRKRKQQQVKDFKNSSNDAQNREGLEYGSKESIDHDAANNVANYSNQDEQNLDNDFGNKRAKKNKSKFMDKSDISIKEENNEFLNEHVKEEPKKKKMKKKGNASSETGDDVHLDMNIEQTIKKETANEKLENAKGGSYEFTKKHKKKRKDKNVSKNEDFTDIDLKTEQCATKEQEGEMLGNENIKEELPAFVKRKRKKKKDKDTSSNGEVDIALQVTKEDEFGK